MKLCGSTSTATLTPPRGGGAAASRARRKPCRSAPRGALTARRKRWRPRSSRDRRLGRAEQRDFAVLRSFRRSARGASACPGAAQRRRARARGHAPRRRRDPRRRRSRREPPERRQAAAPALLGLRSRRSARRRPTIALRSRGVRAARSGAARAPALSPRPARPVAWRSNWNVRSAARGSPLARPTSASTTPTSVSSGKLWPLATSCVPMMTS